MTWLRTYTRNNGATAVQVLWRDADTCKQRSFTYDHRREAEIAMRIIEAAGGRIASAAKLATEIRSAKPRLGEVVSEHISLLTGAGPDTVSRYRRQLDRHIVPTLGGLGVDKLTMRHVAVGGPCPRSRWRPPVGRGRRRPED